MYSRGRSCIFTLHIKFYNNWRNTFMWERYNVVTKFIFCFGFSIFYLSWNKSYTLRMYVWSTWYNEIYFMARKHLFGQNIICGHNRIKLIFFNTLTICSLKMWLCLIEIQITRCNYSFSFKKYKLAYNVSWLCPHASADP